MSFNCDTPQTITFHKENSVEDSSKSTYEISACVLQATSLHSDDQEMHCTSKIKWGQYVWSLHIYWSDCGLKLGFKVKVMDLS